MQTSSKQKLNMHMDFTCHGHLLIHRSPLVQVRKVLPGFFLLYPDAESVKEHHKEQIADKLRSLGLQWKRAALIIELSKHYLAGDWTHVTELPGIGKWVDLTLTSLLPSNGLRLFLCFLCNFPIVWLAYLWWVDICFAVSCLLHRYAADAYAIFAAGKLQQVKPQDHKLVKYWEEVGEMLYGNS